VGHPPPALKSIDRGERVLYAGGFSKVLFPSLRLGYLVVSAELVAIFIRVNQRRNSGASTLAQRAVTVFMTEGHFARHVKRMRGLYAARRQAHAKAVSAVFGDAIGVDIKPGGMHPIVRFCRRRPRRQIGKACSGRRTFCISVVESRPDTCVRAMVAARVHERCRDGRHRYLPPARARDRRSQS
jgi:GntR family transcriptional regulator / MocR family aminotransferase